MALNDLFTALATFQKGVQDLSASRTISQANEAVQQIRTSELKEEEKMNALKNLGQQFAFNLASQGQSASQIQTLLSTFQPQGQEGPRNLFEGLISEDPSIREKAVGAARLQAGLEQEAAQATESRIRERQDIQFKKQEDSRVGREDRRVQRTIQEKTIPGFGVAATVADAKRLRKELPDSLTTLDGVDELLKFGQLDKLDPVQRRRASVIAESLKGASRLSIIGPGAISDQERAILDKVIANPTDILQIPGTERAALLELKERIRTRLQNGLSTSLEDLDDASPQIRQIFPALGTGAPQQPSTLPLSQQPINPSNPADPRNFLR